MGTILTLSLFAFILYRLVRMAEGEADPFAGLVIFGIFGAWLVHVFVNVGMTVGWCRSPASPYLLSVTAGLSS